MKPRAIPPPTRCESRKLRFRDEWRRSFELAQWAIGGGYYARATLIGRTTDRIEGFATEDEAARWAKTRRVPAKLSQ
jgi:hypothetical protein